MATFSQKLTSLMRSRGLTTREVGAAVGLDHSAVARWLKGTKPYSSSLSKLAAFFELPADVLADDSRDLPPDLTKARFDAAHAVAEGIPEDQPQLRRAAFDRHLERGAYVQILRTQAARLRDTAAGLSGDAETLELLARQFEEAPPKRDADADNQKAIEIAAKMNAERDRKLNQEGKGNARAS